MIQDIEEIEKRVRASFERQALMSLIGARLVSVGRGAIDIEWVSATTSRSNEALSTPAS